MLTKKISHCFAIYSLIVFMALTFTARVNAEQLAASVDRDSIGIKETLTLTLSAAGQSKDAPDFSGLKNDFEILSSQRSSSIQIINGRTESSTDWQLVLAPRRTGTLLIPSFNLDNAVSDAIEIKVSQQSQTRQTDSGEQVDTSVELDKSEVYVQEQILVTIKLITRVDLSEAKMEPLDIANSLVVDLGRKQYQTSINGEPHLIVENTYAVFPQQSGDLLIPSLSYEVAIEDMRSLWGNAFGRNRSNLLRLRTAEKHIQVKAIPGQSAGKTWQPATGLTLNETWSGSLDHLKVGEPVTRTITINADSLTGGQIAPIASASIDGLTFYPDQAQTKDNKTPKGVQGARVENMAIVPNRGGDFTLPAVAIEWWNTATQRMETARLPEKTLHVLGSAATPQALPQAGTAAANAPQDTHREPSLAAEQNGSVALWVLLTLGVLAVVLLALLIYILKLKQQLRQWQQQSDRESDRALESQQKEKDIWAALNTAAAAKDLRALRKAVLNWAQWQWPKQPINSLEDIAKLAMSEQLAAELRALDQNLYGNPVAGQWDISALIQQLKAYKTPRSSQSGSELKSLYSQ